MMSASEGIVPYSLTGLTSPSHVSEPHAPPGLGSGWTIRRPSRQAALLGAVP